MSLTINTNVAALNAHNNMVKNDNSLSQSLERLSSGLRINKAADDASGMAIADSLHSQSLGLGQAIQNANDGISMVQTADGALQESINIVDTIKTKSIQSAEDSQTTDSRKAIQSDITKLLQELDNIAKTTSFNGQKLLSGNFSNKSFQVGAYAGETVSVSIGSSEANQIGNVATSELTFAGAGTTELDIHSNIQNQTYSLSSIDLAYDNTAEHGVGAVADAINKMSDVLGITATASVSSTTDSAIAAGTTDSSFAINGVQIGAVTVQANDSDGNLVSAINAKSDQTGVTASVDDSGKLTLTSEDNRAIQVTQGTNTTAVLGGTKDMSTLGTVQLSQTGTGQIIISDRNDQAGVAVSTADGSMKVSGTSATTQLSTLAAGSSLASGTVLASGSIIEGTFKLENKVAVASGATNTAGAGSTLASGSTIGSGVTLTGEATLGGAGSTATSNGTSTLTAGSTLACGSSFAKNTVFTGDVSAYLSDTTTGGIVVSGGNTYVTSGAATVKTGGLTLTAGVSMASGSTLASGTVLNSGSTANTDLTLKSSMTLNGEMSLGTDSVVGSGSVMTTGTVFGTALASGNGKVTGTMTLATGSTIYNGSSLANGSSIGGTVTNVDDETVASNQEMTLAKGSIINSGSTLTAGTVLTNNILDNQGIMHDAGTTLTADITTGSGVALTNAMTLNSGSILKAGTQLAANADASSDAAGASLSGTKTYKLSDVNVTTQQGAQIAITVADAALQNLDGIRSGLGSVQNQLTSTISNLSATQVNIDSAESSIRDVDFASESSNFSKMQVLMQASTFAMAQANASSQSVLSLLK